LRKKRATFPLVCRYLIEQYFFNRYKVWEDVEMNGVNGKTLGSPVAGLTGVSQVGSGTDDLSGTSIGSEDQTLPGGVTGNGGLLDVGNGRSPMRSNPIFRHRIDVGEEVGLSSELCSEFLWRVRDCMMANGVSRVTTERSLEIACKECALSPDKVDVNDLQKLMPAIEKTAQMMLEGPILVKVMGELRLLGHDVANSAAGETPNDYIVDEAPNNGIVGETTRSINIGSEGDALNARSTALEFAMDVGFVNKAAGDVAKVVAELSRNIYQHAISGTIELISVSAGIKIVASDSGPGFSNLEEVFSEEQGSAIKGGAVMCSKLMDEFEIETGNGEKGTTFTKLRNGFEIKRGDGRNGTTVTAIKYRW
jgi:anti-sigma regulatory factor (Ser/Thr protein kinase)